MNKLWLSLNLLVVSIMGYFAAKPIEQPENQITVCHAPVSGDMAQFANDPNFIALHPTPLAIKFVAEGESITYPTADGNTASAYIVKAKKKSDKWLFVYQEWWGLNDHIKHQADVFYNDLGGEVNVIALDMYDGKSTTNPQEAGKLMQGVVESRLENIVKGAITLAGPKAEIANVGWCFGGSWSLKSALLGGKQTIGSVMYYGMPVKDVEKLKTLNSDVLGLFATEQYISQQVIEDFAANMKTANKKLTYKVFNAVHGFSNPSNPKYDEAASKEAYGMAIGYLKEKYKL
ncbi:dienelactone hydrolase family protein [Flectobacillus roseus]